MLTEGEDSKGQRSGSDTGDQDLSVAGGDGSLVEEEAWETGVVKFGIYRSYWSAVASRNINDWWLSYWVTNAEKASHSNSTHSFTTHDQHTGTGRWLTDFRDIGVHDDDKRNSSSGNTVMFYLAVYGSLAGPNSIFTLFRAFLFAYGGICAAETIHKKLLNIILQVTGGARGDAGGSGNRIHGIQELTRHFWNQWLSEYLPTLGSRQKWHKTFRDFKVNDVILIIDPDTPRGQWPLGRVTKVLSGNNGHVRVVEIKTANSLLKRPISRVNLVTESGEIN